ncbi:MAG: hypothetical protein IKK26_02980 [Clostridia bacterium]|nr:hypothetical protein [Clostridia bacterium]
MATVFIFIVLSSFIYTLFLQRFSADAKRVKLYSKTLFIAGIAGAIGLISSFIAFYVHLKSIDNAELYETLRDAFTIFAYPICFWAAAVILITIIAYFINKKTTAIIPAVCNLTAVLSLLWTIVFASWAHFDGFAMNIYEHIIGCALSLLLMLPSSLSLKYFSGLLEDKEFIFRRKHRHDEKHKRSEERKRIRETKNRIKNKTNR